MDNPRVSDWPSALVAGRHSSPTPSSHSCPNMSSVRGGGSLAYRLKLYILMPPQARVQSFSCYRPLRGTVTGHMTWDMFTHTCCHTSTAITRPTET